MDNIEDITDRYLIRRVRAFAAFDRSVTYDRGIVVAYAGDPTVTIRRDDGTQFDWQARLCDFGDKADEGSLPPMVHGNVMRERLARINDLIDMAEERGSVVIPLELVRAAVGRAAPL